MSYPIYYGERLVAEVEATEGGIRAAYSQEWRDNPERFDMSLSLPIQEGPLEGAVLLAWLENLLPEGEPGYVFRQSLGVARGDILGQIEHTGGDLAGALRFGGQRSTAAADYRIIETDEALERIINELPHKPFLVGDEGVSMSLAGAQDKLPVAVIGGRIAIPINGAASTHILKPDNQRLWGSVANEAMCMVLAERCGLNVAPVSIGRAGRREYLLVERYDRRGSAEAEVSRLHQEDFCQALSRPPSAKYENNLTGVRGPSIEEMVGLIRQHMTAREIIAFLDAVIFNIAIGNVDSHAKNYSILLGQNSTELAPLYDLMSGLDWDGITQNHAQKIGGERRGRYIYKKHWERLAQACGLGVTPTLKRVKQVCTRILKELPKAVEQVREMGGHQMLDVFEASICARASLVMANADRDGSGPAPNVVADGSARRETY